MIIALSGFMGCGKSSVGRELAKMTGLPFTDLDEAICGREGKTIPEIFACGGEQAFREAELSALQAFAQDATGSCILSLGGGTLMTASCEAIIRRTATCVYLKAGIDSLVSYLDGHTEGRPMLSGTDLRQRTETLMAQRGPTYERTADLIVETDGLTYGQVAQKIMETLKIHPHTS